MEAEIASELVKQGATLLLLVVPQHTIIGIDTQMFSSGPNFKGVKMIPPGVHFIYYSSANREVNEFSPIVGFFVDASPSEVIVRKWDQKEERFVKLSEEEEERYAQSVKKLEFDRQLGPYALERYGDWKHLSNYITKNTIERIEPLGGEITIFSESEVVENLPKTAMEKILAEQLKGSKFSKSVKEPRSKGCYYTSIPRVIKQKGASGQELTTLNLDKTQILETLLMKQYGGAEDLLLGELQFAFIAFLMGQSLEAFLQWKLLVSLLLGCTEAPLNTRTQLFTKETWAINNSTTVSPILSLHFQDSIQQKFIKSIYYQLKIGFQKDSKDTGIGEKGAMALLDESLLSADNFLRYLCKDFFSLVLDAPMVDGDLLTWTRRLRELLEQTLGWDFQQNAAVDGIHFEEDDEFAPVVEMLDDPDHIETQST